MKITTTRDSQDASNPYQNATIAIVCLGFAMASGLAIHSDGRVAMTIRDRPSTILESSAFLASMCMQPWLMLGLWLESVSGFYFMHMTLESSLVTAVVSGSMMILIMRAIWSRVPTLAVGLASLFVLLMVTNLYSVVLDTTAVSKAASVSPNPTGR